MITKFLLDYVHLKSIFRQLLIFFFLKLKPSSLNFFLRTVLLLSQFSSVAQSCLTICDPMDRSTPGLPVHHQLPEFTQTHVHQVRDAIQPSHPGSSPSPPAPNPSQHQRLFLSTLPNIPSIKRPESAA